MAETLTAGTQKVTIPSITTSTNLGPLPPTSFPPDCLSSLWDFNTFGLGLPWTYETQGCARSTCCPSGIYYTEGWAWLSSYYSPGVCPSQYQTCSPPIGSTALKTSGGESIAFCCPENYLCPTGVHANFICQSGLSTSTSVVVLDNLYEQSTVSTRAFTLTQGFTVSWQIAYPIQVRLKPGEVIQTVASQSRTSTAPPTASTGGSTGATSPSSTGGSSSSTISAGAIAGIVIGAVVGLGVLTLLIWIAMILRKRREQPENHALRNETQQLRVVDHQGGQGAAELFPTSTRPTPRATQTRTELPANSGPRETSELSPDGVHMLASTRDPAELENTSREYSYR